MFERKTVFILGAGASWHYNYPTGEDLVKDIVEKNDELISRLTTKSDSIRWQKDLIEFMFGKFKKDFAANMKVVDFLNNFKDRLKHVDPPVIDYFLEWNEDLRAIGQFMIAWVILDREREYIKREANINRQRVQLESSYLDERNKGVLPHKFKDNWYRFVLYKMLSGCASPEQVADNEVHFITFNYDVSLETYLYKGLRQIQFMKPGQISDDKVKDFLQDRFFHIYGGVREAPFFDTVPVIEDVTKYHDDYREYAKGLQKVYDASHGIRTIGNNKADTSISDSAAEKLLEAEDVYILGYGFDGNNSSEIKIKNALGRKSIVTKSNHEKVFINKKVFFTNFGDKNSINKKASKIFYNNSDDFLTGSNEVQPNRGIGHMAKSSVVYEKSTRNVYDALEQDFGFV